MKEIGKIMGSDARVKILRLFLFNENTPFDAEMIAEKSRVTKPTARKELKMLASIGFTRAKKFTKEKHIQPLKKGNEKKIQKKKASGYVLNKRFPLVSPMKKLLLDPELIPTQDIPKRIKEAGSVKLLTLSGLFKNDHDRKIDMLVVGEKLNKKKLDKAVRVLESEIGKEIRYAIFDTEEFMYRFKMYDQLIREVFNYAHDKLVDKLDIQWK